MNATQKLHALGQSLWLDNITRTLLDDGTLERYIREYAVTGLTSNPDIFKRAIRDSDAYDAGIRAKAAAGDAGENLLIELALEDLRRAADLFKPIHDATRGADGYVSMEVSPLLARDTRGSIAAATRIHRKAARDNLYVKIPGTPAGLPAIEECIFAGIPINVTLLFSTRQYVAAARAWTRGIERRIEAGLDPDVSSVASIFISRWDKAVAARVREDMRNTLGIAVGGHAYHAYRQHLDSPRWRRLIDAGARPQRLLWASTGTKDPDASDTLYVTALAAPQTITTMPAQTLQSLADHGQLQGVMRTDGRAAAATLAKFAKSGVDLDVLAAQLQGEGTQAFIRSWQESLQLIADKSGAPLPG